MIILSSRKGYCITIYDRVLCLSSFTKNTFKLDLKKKNTQGISQYFNSKCFILAKIIHHSRVKAFIIYNVYNKINIYNYLQARLVLNQASGLNLTVNFMTKGSMTRRIIYI